MTSDDQQGGVDSGPRDAAAGFAYAILFIACQVGAVYLSSRWLMGPLLAAIVVGVAPMALVLWAWRDAATQRSRELRPAVRWLGPTAKIGCATTLAFIFWFISWTAWAMTQKEVIGARKAACLSNLKELTRAALEYANGHGGKLPNADTWADDIRPYLSADGRIFTCSEVPHQGFAYAYNASLSEARIDDIEGAAAVVLIYESDAGRNAAGGPELLVAVPRHLGGDNYGFADGHAAWIMRKLRGTDERGNRVYEKVPASEQVPSPLRWRP